MFRLSIVINHCSVAFWPGTWYQSAKMCAVVRPHLLRFPGI